MHKINWEIQRARKIHLLSMIFTLSIGFTFVGSNYGVIASVDEDHFRKMPRELISNEFQNASLSFIPKDIIRNHKFPVLISNNDEVPIYYKGSWASDLFEIEPPYWTPYWIELDGSNEGEGSIQFYQEYNGEIIEFSGTQKIKWSIPEISNMHPVKIGYETYSKNDYLVQFEYTLIAEIFDGYVNINYVTSNDKGPIENSMNEDGLVFPSFADLLTNINLDEAKRFQTWIYKRDITAYDGVNTKYTLILWWEDDTFTRLDYHSQLSGTYISTIFSHNMISDLERTIYNSAIEVMNNSIEVSSSSILYTSSPYWLIASFALIRVYTVRKEKRI